MELDSLRAAFTGKAADVLDAAAARWGRHAAMDTLGLLLTASSDAVGDWQLIWQEFGEPGPDMVGHYRDGVQSPDGQWQGLPVTGTCARAIRAAAILAEGSDMMPASTGLLALCLFADPRSAASLALAGDSAAAREKLLVRVQEALVGSAWPDIEDVLDRCLVQAGAAESDADDDSADWAELERFASEIAERQADQIETLISALNDFLRAGSPVKSGEIIDQHPELLGDDIDRLLNRFIQEASDRGDQADERHLRERRRYLASYRRLRQGTSSGEKESAGTPAETNRRRGECDFSRHSWEESHVSAPRFQSSSMRCRTCHVGGLLEIRSEPDGVHVEYCVVPADGSDTVSRDIVAFFMSLRAELVRDMARDGVAVRPEPPVIGWRPESLGLHTRYTTDG
jgi:hypothetical protein